MTTPAGSRKLSGPVLAIALGACGLGLLVCVCAAGLWLALGGDESTPPPAVAGGLHGAAILLPPDAVAAGEQATIAVDPSPPALPEGCTAAGPTYVITPPPSLGDRAVPFLVRLPLPDPSVAEDSEQAVLIGLYDGREWEVRPAEVIDGSAFATFEHFSRVTAMTTPIRGVPTAEQRQQIRAELSLWGLRIAGDRAFAVFDISHVRRVCWRQGDKIKVFGTPRVRVYACAPTLLTMQNGTTSWRPSPDPRNQRPFQAAGQDLYLQSAAGEKGDVPLAIDPAARIEISGIDSVESTRNWTFSMAPVFFDGAEGPPSNIVYVPVGVAEALLGLRHGLMARIGANDPAAAAFESATIRTPFNVFFSPWLGAEAYGSPTGLSWQFSAFFQDTLWPFIGLKLTSEYCRVTSHEWGHYATHMTLGEEAFQALPSGKHNGWTEQNSRGLAWSEDLATFLGQWAAGTSYPEAAGPMLGHLTDFSRQPEGNEVQNLWPNNRRQDAVRVEGIPATILSRVALKYGFGRVYALLRDRRPGDVVQFFQQWIAAGSLPEQAELQRIYIDEGVNWRVRGRVVGEAERAGDPPVSLPGAQIDVRTLSGEELRVRPELLDEASSSWATADGDGRFVLCLPPGGVRFEIAADGFEPGRFPFTVDTEPSTRTAPDESPPFVLTRRQEARPGFRRLEPRIIDFAVFRENPTAAAYAPSTTASLRDGRAVYEVRRPASAAGRTRDAWRFTIEWTPPPAHVGFDQEYSITMTAAGERTQPGDERMDVNDGLMVFADRTWLRTHTPTYFGPHRPPADDATARVVFRADEQGVYGVTQRWTFRAPEEHGFAIRTFRLQLEFQTGVHEGWVIYEYERE